MLRAREISSRARQAFRSPHRFQSIQPARIFFARHVSPVISSVLNSHETGLGLPKQRGRLYAPGKRNLVSRATSLSIARSNSIDPKCSNLFCTARRSYHHQCAQLTWNGPRSPETLRPALCSEQEKSRLARDEPFDRAIEFSRSKMLKSFEHGGAPSNFSRSFRPRRNSSTSHIIMPCFLSSSDSTKPPSTQPGASIRNDALLAVFRASGADFLIGGYRHGCSGYTR